MSSGSPPAGIAVVRLSGPCAGPALTAITAAALPPPRRARLARLTDPASGDVLDRALTLWFPGPGTATGEDCAELHLHGGRAVVAAVLAALGRIEGLRPAEAGEFTRRAFLNGVIDLIEAEGLADLLAAETEAQRRLALTASDGAVSRQVAAWQAEIVNLGAAVEAALDFADEDDVPADLLEDLATRARAVGRDMGEWLSRPTAERMRDGILVAIAGPPNVGKSTLINALSLREVAITASEAGTTRDIIEVPLALDGIPFRFADTAGLRGDSDSAVEAEGIARARALLERADLILWLGDPAYPPEGQAPVLRVASQADRHARDDPAWTHRVGMSDVVLSARTGEGMKDLHRLLLQHAATLLPRLDEAALYAAQRTALAQAAAALAIDRVAASDPILLAEHLRLARAALLRMTGRDSTEAMLDALFGRFCIGK